MANQTPPTLRAAIEAIRDRLLATAGHESRAHELTAALALPDAPQRPTVRVVTDPESACSDCSTLTHCKHAGRCLAECEPADLAQPDAGEAIPSELRVAIDPNGKIDSFKGLVALASAHRQDSEMIDTLENPTEAPIPMVLPCPKCGTLHIDAPNPERGWDNPPHRSHECQGCGTIWRPADVPTAGVLAVETTGKADTWKPADTPPPSPQLSLTQEEWSELEHAAFVMIDRTYTPERKEYFRALALKCRAHAEPETGR